MTARGSRRTSRVAIVSYTFGLGYTFPSRINHIPVTLFLDPLSAISRRWITNRSGGCICAGTYSNPLTYRGSSLRISSRLSLCTERYSLLSLGVSIEGVGDHPLDPEVVVVGQRVEEWRKSKIVHPTCQPGAACHRTSRAELYLRLFGSG